MTSSLATATPEGLARVKAWIEQSEMAKWVALDAALTEDGLHYSQTFDDKHIGNDLSRFFHGGVVSTFLQLCATAEALGRLDPGIQSKVVSIHCNYLRPARPLNMQGSVSIMQTGRRVAFFDSVCWQDDETKPVARAAVALRLMEKG